MNIKAIQAENRRLMILQLLAADTDYSANDTLLQELLAMQGNGAPLDVVRTDLAWLSEQDLVVIRDLPGCKVASLRRRGVDVANGLAVVPGIARPSPNNG
ncbi:MAG: ArsR family transcriptional regulator [Methyloprofundus sp.]|nr:ArsR family transcriptional regulator [Methyloprofundus sp.]